jgi:hypothetical protein
VIFRLLAKQKEQRFPDARTVRIALERYLETLGSGRNKHGKNKQDDALTDVVTTGGPDLSGLVAINRPLPDALRPRPLTLVEMMDPHALHRRPWFRAAIAVGALALIGGGVALWWFLQRPGPDHRQPARGQGRPHRRRPRHRADRPTPSNQRWRRSTLNLSLRTCP